MKRIITAIIIISLFAFLLVACGDGREEQSELPIDNVNIDNVNVGNAVIDNMIIDNYVFLSQRIDLPTIPYEILGATLHENHLFYWFTNSIPQLVVVELTADGNVVQETYIPLQEGVVHSVSLHITENNYFEIITVIDEADNGVTVLYEIYSRQGENISTLDLNHIVSPGNFIFHVSQVIFTNDGNFVLAIMKGGHAYEIYVLNSDGTLLGQLQLDFNSNLIKLQDGRVVALISDRESNSLREIDFAAGDWGETLPLAVTYVQEVFPSESSQPYDFLIDDGSYLVGYTLETATQTPILNLFEIGIIDLTDSYSGFFPDGRFFTLTTSFLTDWLAELYIFTPTPREDIQEQPITLTLGGIQFTSEIRREVLRFNRENQEYQIELYEFGDGTNRDAALLRFQVEMVAGRGPDIIFNDGIPQIDAHFMVDLNSLIDADSEITRTDFFPNFLNALETYDGVLPFLSTSFTIDTMITVQDTATQIYPLTFETLLGRLREADEPHLFGIWNLRDNFLMNSLLFSGDTFIDWKNSQANLNSDAFIQMLEIAISVPDEPLAADSWTMVEEIRRLHTGEQLLYDYNFHDPVNMQILMGMLGDEITVIGMPTPTGGRHLINPEPGIGINATSPHQDAAWSFVRQLLLPDAYLQFGLPLRIEHFETRITELMTPVLWEETNPDWNAVEGEEMPVRIDVGVIFYLYALREDQAALIREVVESADMIIHHDETISMIVREESQAFFLGDRTAEDTARIIQNRVQIYLSERE